MSRIEVPESASKQAGEYHTLPRGSLVKLVHMRRWTTAGLGRGALDLARLLPNTAVEVKVEHLVD